MQSVRREEAMVAAVVEHIINFAHVDICVSSNGEGVQGGVAVSAKYTSKLRIEETRKLSVYLAQLYF